MSDSSAPPLRILRRRVHDGKLTAAMLERTIRQAVESDIPQMHRVRMDVRENRLTNPDAVQPDDYRAMLRSGGGWVCEVGGRVVGFAIADLPTSSVWALFVDPGCERQGIGRQLHDTILKWLFDRGATTVSLTTDSNTRAERFYLAAGWRYVSREKNGEGRYEITRDAFLAGVPSGL